MFNVKTDSKTRKIEFFKGDEGFENLLLDAMTQVNGFSNNAFCVYISDTDIGLYYKGKPKDCPVDVSDVETDPRMENLISFKIDKKTGKTRVKTYFWVDKYSEFSDLNVDAVGYYKGEEIITLYTRSKENPKELSSITYKDKSLSEVLNVSDYITA